MLVLATIISFYLSLRCASSIRRLEDIIDNDIDDESSIIKSITESDFEDDDEILAGLWIIKFYTPYVLPNSHPYIAYTSYIHLFKTQITLMYNVFDLCMKNTNYAMC